MNEYQAIATSAATASRIVRTRNAAALMTAPRLVIEATLPGDDGQGFIVIYDFPDASRAYAAGVEMAAYLASVYLVWDAQRLSDEGMVAYFRRRAVGAAIVAGVLALAGIFVLRADARFLFDGLTSRALPLVILSAIAGAGSLLLLLRRSQRGARLLSMTAVVTIVLAWGVAQWDFMLPQSLTVAQAAAPSGTIEAMLLAVALAALLVGPGFVLLYVLDQRGLLPGEGVDDHAEP